MGGLKPSGAGTATTYAHVGHAAPCTSGSFASKNPMGPAARSLRIDSASAGNVGGAVTGLGPSVAVIGAGAAGLAAGRILREEGLRVTIFEKAQDMGGVWRYNPEPAAGAPMYRSLVTNLPKQTMSFFGFPFASELPSFTTHTQVLDYLCAYAERYDLGALVKFGCPVTSVRLVGDRSSLPASGSAPAPAAAVTGERGGYGQQEDGRETGAIGRWEVIYQQTPHPSVDAPGGTKGGGGTPAAAAVTEIFDAVCVCNGHYDAAYAPDVEGVGDFRGTVMHARAYDRPDVEAFAGRRVLCVGARSSGTDIAREVSSVATVVHVSDRSASDSAKGGERGNVWWRPGLARFEGSNGVRFADGVLAEVDTVVWCTGYSYSFPFLEGSRLLASPVTERVRPLYEQVFHIHHPSLSFVGLPQSVIPFPLFEIQANLVAAAISGRVPLPSRASREQWLVEEDKRMLERGVNPASRGVHVLGVRQWPYLKNLVRLAGGVGVVPQAPLTDDGDGGGGRGRDAAEHDEKGQDDGAKETQGMLAAMGLREVMYNDTSRSRPKFPGDPDDYRRRVYSPEWQAGTFSVSWAKRKANGEGPSSSTSASASSGATSGVTV